MRVPVAIVNLALIKGAFAANDLVYMVAVVAADVVDDEIVGFVVGLKIRNITVAAFAAFYKLHHLYMMLLIVKLAIRKSP